MSETILVGQGEFITAVPHDDWAKELDEAPEFIRKCLEFMSRDHHAARNFVVGELPEHVNNEPMDATTGIKVTHYYVADDFTASTPANATTVSFELGDWNGDFPGGSVYTTRYHVSFNLGQQAEGL